MLSDVRRALGDEEGARLAYARGVELAPDYARLTRPTLQSRRRQALMAPPPEKRKRPRSAGQRCERLHQFDARRLARPRGGREVAHQRRRRPERP
ncbi:MAG: hypothetical protein WKF30_09295 [Pyrinomonadaceae bacterium]